MLYLFLSALIVAGDQLFKIWTVNNIELGAHADFIPGIIRLTHIRNTGASFSMLSGQRWLLLSITGIAIILIIIYLFKTRMGPLARFAIASVLGGALGNAIDRLISGYVVDMFELEFIDYAIFNIADCFIVAGGILFCLCYIITSVKQEKREKSPVSAPEGDAFPDVGHDKPDAAAGPARDGEVIWTETQILEDYDVQRRMTESGDDY